IEHCDNPIRVLVEEWLPLLREGGVLYLSLPSTRNACEKERVATPIDHILADYYFSREADAYESKSHIYSFILQWTALSVNNFWYARNDVQSFAANALQVALRETHDLHWHSYTLAVAS